jgi:thiol-disulfide isomerase/thioredoxin
MKRRALMSLMTLFSVAGLVMAQPAGTKPAPAAPASPKVTEPAKTPSDGPGKDSAEPTLKVGSAAPSIQISDWVKGSPVKGFEKGKVYVVEFWATWCPPCRDSIPHLTELQKKHKGITVVGVAGSERKGKDGDDRLQKLKEFVSKQAGKMDYTVGYDADRKMVKDWMAASGQKGIPCAFIVGGDGKIAWIGNPLDDEFEDYVENAIKAAAPKTTDPAPKKKG